MHSAITGTTCSPRMPWRSTNAFCAPIAAINAMVVRKPMNTGEAMRMTVGHPGCIKYS